MAKVKTKKEEPYLDEWDKKANKVFNFTIQLSISERNKIGELTTYLVNSIFKREDDPVKRRLLIKQVNVELSYQISVECNNKIHSILEKQRKEKREKAAKRKASKK